MEGENWVQEGMGREMRQGVDRIRGRESRREKGKLKVGRWAHLKNVQETGN